MDATLLFIGFICGALIVMVIKDKYQYWNGYNTALQEVLKLMNKN